MFWAILFLFGAAIGSFMNVLDLRYDGDHFILDTKVIGGRSHCPHCKKTLTWFELIPILSYFLQGGKCRGCKTKISFQYPLVEAVSGFIFLLVPLRIGELYGSVGHISIWAFWIIALEILLLISLIDLRLGIIPDELNLALGAVGIFLTIYTADQFGLANASLIGPYALIFGGQGSIVLARVLGFLAGGGFFSALVLVTRGKGMGMGDVKLAFALGALFGWPDIALVSSIAFVLGATVGLLAVAARKRTIKGSIPFGPFLAAGAAVVFFFGFEISAWYFRLTGMG